MCIEYDLVGQLLMPVTVSYNNGDNYNNN